MNLSPVSEVSQMHVPKWVVLALTPLSACAQANNKPAVEFVNRPSQPSCSAMSVTLSTSRCVMKQSDSSLRKWV